MKEILNIKNKEEFRDWLERNHESENECYLILKRGKPIDDGLFYYIDAVYTSICFGWIDSTLTTINGIRVQRFSKRVSGSNWTELNKDRARYLIKNGLMTAAGFRVLPNMDFVIPEDIINDIKEAGVYEEFMSFPENYRRIRLYNLKFTKDKLSSSYEKAFSNFVKYTKEKKMYGNYDDYGRL